MNSQWNNLINDKNCLTKIPYLQHFIGLDSFVEVPPFDASFMVHFRKRLSKDIINEVSEMIANEYEKHKPPDDDFPGNSNPDAPETSISTDEDKIKNAGKLILDAT